MEKPKPLKSAKKYAHVRPKVDCRWSNGVPLRKFLAMTPREDGQIAPSSEQLRPRGRASLGSSEIASRSAEIFSAHNSLSFLIDQPPLASTPKRREANVNFRRGSIGQGPASSRLFSSIARRSDGFFDGRNIQKILNLQETKMRRNESIEKEAQEIAAKMKILAEGVPMASSPENPFVNPAIVEIPPETQIMVEHPPEAPVNVENENTSDYNSDSQTSQQSQERSASGNALQPGNSNLVSKIPVRAKTPAKSPNPIILVSRNSPNENKENNKDWSNTPVAARKAYFEANQH